MKMLYVQIFALAAAVVQYRVTVVHEGTWQVGYVNTEAGGDVETHQGETKIFQTAVSANVMGRHTDAVDVVLTPVTSA